jgi:hypothetical protein
MLVPLVHSTAVPGINVLAKLSATTTTFCLDSIQFLALGRVYRIFLSHDLVRTDQYTLELIPMREGPLRILIDTNLAVRGKRLAPRKGSLSTRIFHLIENLSLRVLLPPRSPSQEYIVRLGDVDKASLQLWIELSPPCVHF